MPAPSQAISSRGIDRPAANASVRATSPQLRPSEAARTVIAASTGPAHGTNTTPRVSPNTKADPFRTGPRVGKR